MYRIFSVWKKSFCYLDTTPKHSSFAFGGPLQQAGFWSSLETRFAVFMFWARLNLFSRAQRWLFHTSPRDSLSADTWAESEHCGLHCQKGGDSLAVLKLSPVCWKMDPILSHTLRENLACALWSGLANLFPWSQAYCQTWSAKPQQLFLMWHLWVNACRIWLSHLRKQLHLSCWSLFETWFNCILTVQCLAYACHVTQMLPSLLFLWVHLGLDCLPAVYKELLSLFSVKVVV